MTGWVANPPWMRERYDMMPRVQKALQREWPIVVILVAYLALGIVYGVVNPVFEAPDEPQHFFFVKHLADGKGLPVQSQSGKQAWAQEGSQPPLYYALAALIISGVDTSDAERLLWANPHVNMGVPLAQANKNVYIHTERERFPYRGTTLAVHLLRLFSTLMGAGTVLATYCTMRLAFPSQPALAVGAAALNAFTPQFVFIHSAVNNDTLVTLLGSWAFWAMVRLWSRPLRWRTGLGLGLLIGGASLAKLSGLGLIPLLGLNLVLLWWRGRPWRVLLRVGAVAMVVVSAISGWWFARNLLLYGDLTGLEAMLDVFGRRQVPPGLAALLAEAEGLRISYWAIFGWFNILSASLLYKLLDGLLLIAGVGLLVGLGRRGKNMEEKGLAWGVLAAAWFLIILIALIRWTRMTSGTQGRLLFPAISAVSGLIFVGSASWLPQRACPTLAAGLGSAFFCWAFICPFAHIAPAYARPPILSPKEVPAAARPVHITYGDQLELISYTLDRDSVAPGETLHIAAYWRCLSAMELDYSLYVHLFGREGQAIGQVDTYPGGGTYPTSLWQVGDVIQDRYAVTVKTEAMVPVFARIEIGPYLIGSQKVLPMADGQGRPLKSPVVGRVRVAAAQSPQPDIEKRTDWIFGEQIALLGYKLDKADLKPGGQLTLTLFWQALRPLTQDYTVFIHLGTSGIAGQRDSKPLDGDYPTLAWKTGEIVRDVHIVPVKSGASGEYPLIVGLYELESGRRLALPDGIDHATLDQIVVSW